MIYNLRGGSKVALWHAYLPIKGKLMCYTYAHLPVLFF